MITLVEITENMFCESESLKRANLLAMTETEQFLKSNYQRTQN